MGIDDERDERPAPPDRAPGFDALHAAIAPDIARYAYLLTASPTRATHVTRHAFARVWRELPDITNTPADAGYVRTLAGDLALSRRFLLRRALWRLVPHPDRTAAVVPHAADDACRDQDIALLRALQRVPAHRRRVFVLRHLFGMSPEEVAVETEATTEATRIRLVHAHEDLAEWVPALTGPSPNCPEAHAYLTRITRDLAARHEPRVPGPHAVRVRTRTRTGALVAVVAAAILALFGASLPRLITPGTSPNSRAGDRVRPITGPEVARMVPPVPAERDAPAPEPPQPPAAAPPAPAQAPGTPAAPSPTPTPAPPPPTEPAPAGTPTQPGRITPLVRPAAPAAIRRQSGASTIIGRAQAGGPAALLSPQHTFIVETSCLDNGLRRASPP
ncbi:RNA polymerase sigma factor [Embleya sp. AB8]|uniref:RNA polymerase sigma factor n=1 Tax=Embleya sp. AB8 TaxID=3156304 RepID=UPI003C74C210